MMRKLLSEAMKSSISEVLETMFFCPLEFVPPPDAGAAGTPPPEGEPTLSARIAFAGPLTGCMRLTLPLSLALFLAADFLGVDESGVSDRQRDETVAEMLNMFAGNTFSRFDATAVFDLGLPAIGGPAEAPGAATSHVENSIEIFGRTLHGPIACELIVEKNEWTRAGISAS